MVDRERVRELHRHLEATARRPVERSAGRWLGEAEAVAADAARDDPPAAVVRKRVEQARDLLANVEGTGDDEADEHVAAARRLAAAVLEDAGQ